MPRKPKKANSAAATFAVAPSQLDLFLKIANGLPTEPPSLYVDGGFRRGGRVAFLLLHVPPHSATYHIPLAQGLLSVGGEGTLSLKSILESDSIPKVTFDARGLSHALWHHHGVELAGVRDLQLMELATRAKKQYKKYLAGLAKCVEQDLAPTCEIRKRWLEGSDKGTRSGRAPGQPAVRRVEVLPALWDVYHSKLSLPKYMLWIPQVQAQTAKRLTASRQPSTDTDADSNALGPPEWCDKELLKALE